MPLSFVTARFAARFGPKHGILISNLLYIPAMVVLGFVPDIGQIGIFIWGFILAISTSLFGICSSIDFSKVKNTIHAGKELAFMYIFEKLAFGVSPVIGGIVALWFGPQVIMWVSAGFFAIAAIPLLRTAEQTHTHQKLDYKGFPWAMAFRSLFAQTGAGFDILTSATVWSLFIAVVIFPGIGNEVYVTLGALSSITIIASIIASFVYGKLIDRSKGGMLLKVSVIANALVHLSRPFVSTPASIVTTNVTNEIATMGYTMAFSRGVYDTADISGHRIVYLSTADAIANFGAALACIVLLIFVSVFGAIDGLRDFFFVAAGFALLVGTANFRLYRK